MLELWVKRRAICKLRIRHSTYGFFRVLDRSSNSYPVGNPAAQFDLPGVRIEVGAARLQEI
jgi:hypothetical protein